MYITDINLCCFFQNMSANMIGEEETPTLEGTPAPQPLVPQPLSPPVVVAVSPPLVVAEAAPADGVDNPCQDVRPDHRPEGLGAVQRRSSSSSSSASRGRARSSAPPRSRGQDRARDNMDRQERRLRTETKLIAQLQGAVDIASRHLADYTTVVSREVTAVNSLRRERDGVKASETRMQQELAAVRGDLKKKVIG